MIFFLDKKSKYSFFLSSTTFSEKSGAGFTLIEILVVVSIIIVLSVIVLSNYEFGGYQFSLQRSVSKLSQDIRTAEEMSMSARPFQGFVPPGGYGIYLEHSSSSYYLFADQNSDGSYESNEIAEVLELEEGTQINQLCLRQSSNPPSGTCDCQNTYSIVFVPPDPTIKFNNNVAGTCLLEVTFWSSKVDQYSTLNLRPTGLIEIVD